MHLAYLINRPSRILITMEVTTFYLERVKSVSFLIYITHFCSFGFLKRPNLPADLAFTITSDFRAYAAFSFFFPFRVPSNERCWNAIATADSGWGERGRGRRRRRWVSISKMRRRTDLRAMYGGRQLRRARGKSEIILRRVRVALPFPIETRINTGLERATETEGDGRARERETESGPCSHGGMHGASATARVYVQGDTRARIHAVVYTVCPGSTIWYATQWKIIREPSENLFPRHLVSRGYLCERLEIGEEIILTSIKICILISSATRMFNVEIKNL